MVLAGDGEGDAQAEGSELRCRTRVRSNFFAPVRGASGVKHASEAEEPSDELDTLRPLPIADAWGTGGEKSWKAALLAERSEATERTARIFCSSPAECHR